MAEQKRDSIRFEIFQHSLTYIAEEMGIVLRRTAYSPNIKERLDFSCAVFDSKGRLAGQAEHIPVHLGAMPSALKTILEDFHDDIHEGDVFAFNDPFRGGTHLPDITLASPVFAEGETLAFVANRAHHADVGGAIAGSMSGFSSEVYEEGLIIPPIRLQNKDGINTDVLKMLEANIRTPQERRGDLYAQIASLNLGAKRLTELNQQLGTSQVHEMMHDLMDYSEKLTRNEIGKLKDGVFKAEEFLDEDGKSEDLVRICVEITKYGEEASFDFTGSDQQRPGPINAVFPVTLSAVYFVMRCLTDPSIPTNDGCYRPLHVKAPIGSVVNAQSPAAVAGGNVETSQRIVDVLLKAFGQAYPEKIPAGCQGTMNNLTIGGSVSGRRFSYYETVGGGYGARRGLDGPDGIHSHMTNTLNTPIEALEIAYPLMVTRYEFRSGTSGTGQYRGGMGLRRDVRILCDDAVVSVLGDRQKTRPWGLLGGDEGSPGKYELLDPAGKAIPAKSKATFRVKQHWTVSLQTPGGGGYGPKEKREKALSEADIDDGKTDAESSA